MSSVDNRIVNMQFNNKQFEDGVQTSMKSLDNLKKGLNMDDSTKSMTNLERAVQSISDKFSTLGIIGVTALANITNSVVNTGKNLISSLTIDPIKMGFDEYETKMNAIQTILTNTASKGTTLKEVTATLDELNTYADQTIYNFAEMTRNIGTFTAAGVDLKTSAAAIKGIANLAAGSGSNAQQASTAMYQLSQALAAGTVKLMDWNSVVNAGMGGELFKNALLQTAKAQKAVQTQFVNGQEMIVTYTKKGQKELKSFRDSLEEGWLTSKVLISTLEKFAKDPALLQAATQVKTFTQMLDTMRESVQSGWAQTWETIIGNKDEAAKLFTSINNSFGAIAGGSADARNKMLAFWKANGGRDMLIEGLTNSFKALEAVLKPVGDAFREVFPAMTGERLVAMTKAFRDLTTHFKIGEETANNLRITFKGLFAVLDIGLKVFKLLATVGGLLIKALLPASGTFLSITASISNYLVKLNDSIEKSNAVNIAVEKMGQAFKIVGDAIGYALAGLGPMLNTLKPILAKLGESLKTLFYGTTVFAAGLDDTKDAFANTETMSDKLNKALTAVHNTMIRIKDGFVATAKAIKSIIVPIFDTLKKKVDDLSLQDIGALMTGSGFLIFAKSISKGISSVDEILGNFANILGQVGDTLKAFQLKVKAEALLKIAVALGILAMAIVALSFIEPEKLTSALIALGLVLGALVISLRLLDKNSKGLDLSKVTNMFGKIGTAVQVVGIATALLILAGALKIIASIDRTKLIEGVAAIAALLSVLALFIKVTKGGDLKASASGLTAFAIGITILTGALAILGNLKYEQLAQGVMAITTLIAVIGAFVNLTKGGDLAGKSASLMGFAIGMTILAGALSILGKLKYEQLAQGTMAIATLMGAIMVFINMTKGGDLAGTAGGLIGFSLGILMLTGALAILGKLKYEQLMQGTLAISTLMFVIANFIRVTKGGALVESAGGLIGFSIGIILMTRALAILGGIDKGKVIQGTIAISALMNVIAAFIRVTDGGDLVGRAAGLIGFSIGLIALSGAVFILANIDPKKVKQGIISVVTLMTAIAAFINLTKEGDLKKSAAGLIGFATGLMILAGVIAILSALNPQKLILASVAVATLITAIAMFVNLTRGSDLTVSAGGLMGFSIAIGLLAISLIAIAQLDYKQILSTGLAISLLLGSIIAFTKLTSGGQVLMAAGSLVVFSGAILLLTKVLTTLGTVDIKTLLIGVGALAGMLIVLGLTSAVLAPLVPAMLGLSAALALFGVGVLAIGGGMLAFATGMDLMAKSGKAGSDTLVEAVKKIMGLIPLALTTLALGMVGFAKTLGDNAPVVAESFMKVITAITETSVAAIPQMVTAGLALVAGILSGIANNIQKIVEAGIDIILNFIMGINNKLPAIINTAFTVIITLINGLADAIDKNHNAIYEACSKLITSIINAVVDLIPNVVDLGVNVIKGFIGGIGSMRKGLDEAMTGVVNGAVDGVKKLLGIHSPSKVFGEIGKFSMMGFANGISNYAGMVGTEARNVGNTAMDNLRNAMANISDAVSSDMDMNPTIRPVLDLTDITNGAGTINSLFNKAQGINVSTANARAASISNSMRPSTLEGQNGSSNAGTAGTPTDGSPKQPMVLQLMLQNGKALTEFIIDDINSLMGGKNNITGRAAGI